jgi:hypothetical protein
MEVDVTFLSVYDDMTFSQYLYLSIFLSCRFNTRIHTSREREKSHILTSKMLLSFCFVNIALSHWALGKIELARAHKSPVATSLTQLTAKIFKPIKGKYI